MDTSLLHQYGPWILLAGGIFGLLQATVFYRAIHRSGQHLVESEFMQKKAKQSTVSRLTLLFAERSLQSPAMRWFSAAWSVGLITGAVAWFALRP